MSDLEYELIYYFPKDKKGLKKKISKDKKKSNPFTGSKNNIYNKIIKNL